MYSQICNAAFMSHRPSVVGLRLCALQMAGGHRLGLPLVATRGKRYEAFDANLDKEALAETHAWFSKLDKSQLPKGDVKFARSSGAGGQHVNKTETKAITVFPVWELLALMPTLLHPFVRESRYYTASNDSLTFHAQTTRSRTANQEENRRKLMDEITRIYRENTPNETSEEKKNKYQEITKNFHESRVRSKKLQSTKKKSRKGSVD